MAHFRECPLLNAPFLLPSEEGWIVEIQLLREEKFLGPMIYVSVIIKISVLQPSKNKIHVLFTFLLSTDICKMFPFFAILILC